MNPSLRITQDRIADCLVHGRDHLNLAGLGLSDTELLAPFTHQGEEMRFAQLTALRYLDLSENALTALPDCVGTFSELLWLGLNFNRIAQLGGIEHLIFLQRLYAMDNELADLPEDFGNLSALLELDLRGNPLVVLPSSLGHLTRLQHVALSAGALRADLKAVWGPREDWPRLRDHLRQGDEQAHRAYLESPRFKETWINLGHTGGLFAELAQAAKSRHEFRQVLARRRADLFPPDAAAPEVTDVRRSFFMGKVVLVGQMGHGKTTLQKSLRGLPTADAEASTLGMNRAQLSLGHDGALIHEARRGERNGPQADLIDLQIWDMGGQEDFQFPNQLFYTPGALYLAVVRVGRSEHTQTPTLRDSPWADRMKADLLRVHRRTGGKAEVILVFTDAADGLPDKLTEAQVRRMFPPEIERMIKHLHCVDSINEGDREGVGIPELRQRIAGMVCEPGSTYERIWNFGWKEFFHDLNTCGREFLHFADLQQKREEHQIEGDAQVLEDLVRMGHDIGFLLWRSPEDRSEQPLPGEDVVVLDPNWLCRAVVRLLKDGTARNQHGFIDDATLRRIWGGTDDNGHAGVEPADHETVKELLEINDLAYRHTERGRYGRGEWLLVAQMVDEHRPGDLDARWEALRADKPWREKVTVTFHPAKGNGTLSIPELMYAMIVRLRHFSLGWHEKDKAVHWSGGLLVQTSKGGPNPAVALVEWGEQELSISVAAEGAPIFWENIVELIYDEHLNEVYHARKKVHVSCGAWCRGNAEGCGRFSLEACKASAGRDRLYCANCEVYYDFAKVRPFVPVPAKPVDVVGQLTEVITAAKTAVIEAVQQAQAQNRGDHRFTHVLVQESRHDVLATLEETTQRILLDANSTRQQLHEAITSMGINLTATMKTLADYQLRALVSDSATGPRLYSARPVDPKGWLETNLSELEFTITTWCEASLQPLPFVTNKLGEGQFTVRLPRAWIRGARCLLRYGFVAGLALTGAGAVQFKCDEAVVNEFASGWEALKELMHLMKHTHLGATDEGRSGIDETLELNRLGSLGFGVPMERDTAITHLLRTEADAWTSKQLGRRFWGMQWVQSESHNDYRIWEHPEWRKRFG